MNVRKNIIKIYVLIIAIGLTYFLLMKFTGFYIPCLYHKILGVECPGCGLSAMLISLMKFDIKMAFLSNPVMFILINIWNLIAILSFWGKLKIFRNEKFLLSLLIISVIILIIFTVVRNIF